MMQPPKGFRVIEIEIAPKSLDLRLRVMKSPTTKQVVIESSPFASSAEVYVVSVQGRSGAKKQERIVFALIEGSTIDRGTRST
ncbi:hypothetical protein M8J75_006444 [Diaphorina citri]|jgi:hypothetical protein|nr:hypothetical protein M8J75_006444 [Diaphorina citri]